MQLVGRGSVHDPVDVDLAALQERGVRLVGRFAGLNAGRARFRPDLAEQVAAADARMHRLLDAIDAHVHRSGRTTEFAVPHRPRALAVPAPVEDLHLSRCGIGTVLVAAGYQPDYPWLRLPITDANGTIRQCRGVTPAPGVYVVGQRFQHRRDSGFIDGARHDARAVVGHLLTGSIAPRSHECSAEHAA